MKDTHIIDGKEYTRETYHTITVNAQTPEKAIEMIKQGRYAENLVFTTIAKESE